MNSPFLNDLETSLFNRARKYLVHGRPGDVEHTLRVVETGRVIASREGEDADLVVCALILHDVGWSQVDYQVFLNQPIEKHSTCLEALLHQELGAGVAKKIMIQHDIPRETIDRIARYIFVHDQVEKTKALGDPMAMICLEADFLDRFGASGLSRFKRMFNGAFDEKHAVEFLIKDAETWLKTKTGHEILHRKTTELKRREQPAIPTG